MDRRTKSCVVLAIALGAALRFLGLGALPRGLHPDEAAEALEARSLAATLRSTDGRRFPLVFDHHGLGWAEGTYSWLAAPCVALGGDDVERAVRIPAALAGLFAVLGAFRLARALCGERAAAIAAVLVATEPIAVHFSRGAFRASLEPALFSLGLALALEGLDRAGSRRVLAGATLLALGVVTYPPARLVVPIAAIAFALGAPRASREQRAALLVPVLGALLAILPFALSPAGAMRLRDIAITNAPGPHDGASHGPVLDALRAYVLHFAPRTLVVGDFARGFWAYDVPPLLYVEAPLIIIGVIALARRARADHRARLALVLLFAAPLASCVTRPSPNLIRAIFLVPSLAIVAAAGADRVVDAAAARRAPVAIALALAWLGSLTIAIGLYVARFPERPSAWQPFERERAKIDRLSGDFKLDSPLERSLVDLYARRRIVWADGERSRTEGWIAPPR